MCADAFLKPADTIRRPADANPNRALVIPVIAEAVTKRAVAVTE
jgi:hypothetical protein